MRSPHAVVVASILFGLLIMAGAPAWPADLRPQSPDGLGLVFREGGELRAVSAGGKPLPVGAAQGGLFLTTTRTEHRNLLTNGSLEADADSDGVPDGCIPEGLWKRDDAIAHTGRCSMRCEIPGTEDQRSGSFGAVVPVRGAGTYRISLWMRSRGRGGTNAGSIVYVQQQDEKGARTTPEFQQSLVGGVSGDSDWTEVSGLVATQAATRRLYVRTDIWRGYGTLWVDDIAVEELAGESAHLATRARRARDGVAISGEDARRQFRVSGVWQSDRRRGCLTFHGWVRDLSGQDRCTTVSYRLPVDLQGGRWWNDTDECETIGPTGAHSRTEALGAFGPYSIYPWSAVEPRPPGVGLSLAVPMVPPRPFRLLAGAQEGLAAEFDFGLTPLCRAYPSCADFHLALYGHDPKWGFRSATERYYRLYPECFQTRVTRQGNWYYHDLTKLPQPEDFGLAFNEMTTPESLTADHRLGYLAFRYTEPWGWWGWAFGQHPRQEDPPQPLDDTVALLRRLAADDALAARGGANNNALVARSILNSGIYDRSGKLQSRGYVAAWGGHNFALNPSPYAVAKGAFSRFQATYDWEIDPGLRDGVDGIYLDSIDGSWTALGNYRPEHLAASRHPLTFSRSDPQPAQLGVWNQYEFVESVARDLHRRGKLLMANIFPYQWTFFNAQLDLMGHEVWAADAPARMRAARALAYQKPYCWLMVLDPELPAATRERYLREAMSYGIFPNIVGGTTDPALYERFRPLYRRYMPTILALAQAGWEPVTHARAMASLGARVSVERFGPRDGALFFTLRNDSDVAARVRLVVDTGALGRPALRQATLRPEGEAARVDANGGVLMRIGPRDQAALEIR